MEDFATRARAALSLIGALVVLGGCAHTSARFAHRATLWQDDDRQPFAGPPEPRYAPELWDAADLMVLRPAARALAFETSGESVNVNALDEVPSSSWFENRIGRAPMTPEAIARGACGDQEVAPAPPWRVVSGKVDGATAGFVFEDARGRRFLFKADREAQPEQSTAADAISAALYHAVGYHVPCNRVVHFEREWIELDPEATVDPTSGHERPMTRDDLVSVFDRVREAPDGRLRGTISVLFEGEALGPWDYRGTWDRDLNDVVPHEDRRELRAMRLLNAWVDHWDARQLNTLSTWVETAPGAGHVQHHVVDLGETLGFVQGTHRAATRYGRSQWLDTQHVVEDLFTFGLVTRPWDTVERGPTWPLLGYFDVEHFDPDEWRPNYWNGAFERQTERDAAWMARILARVREPHLRALIELGAFTDPAVEERLFEMLQGRREVILERHLTRLSPLSWPTVSDARLCLEDLAISSGLRSAGTRHHEAWLVDGSGTPTHALSVVQEDAHACVVLPSMPDPYVVVRMRASTPRLESTYPADVHVTNAQGRWQVVGLTRADGEREPS